MGPYAEGQQITLVATGWDEAGDYGWAWGVRPLGFIVNGVRYNSSSVTITMTSNMAVLVLWEGYMIEGGFPEEDSGPPVMGPEWEGQDIDWESLPEGSSLVGGEDWIPHPGGGWMAPEPPEDQIPEDTGGGGGDKGEDTGVAPAK